MNSGESIVKDNDHGFAFGQATRPICTVIPRGSIINCVGPLFADQEVAHIPRLHHIFAPFCAHLPRSLDRAFRVQFGQIIHGIDLRANELLFKVRVNDPRRGGSYRAL